jgi:hypothetical protein
MNWNPNDEEDDQCIPNEDESDSSNNGYSSEDYRNAKNCAPWAHTNMSEQEKLNAARNLGPNWANIIAGLGDQ